MLKQDISSWSVSDVKLWLNGLRWDQEPAALSKVIDVCESQKIDGTALMALQPGDTTLLGCGSVELVQYLWSDLLDRKYHSSSTHKGQVQVRWKTVEETYLLGTITTGQENQATAVDHSFIADLRKIIQQKFNLQSVHSICPEPPVSYSILNAALTACANGQFLFWDEQRSVAMSQNTEQTTPIMPYLLGDHPDKVCRVADDAAWLICMIVLFIDTLTMHVWLLSGPHVLCSATLVLQEQNEQPSTTPDEQNEQSGICEERRSTSKPWVCDHGCGFTHMDFEIAKAHERECAFRADCSHPAAAADEVLFGCTVHCCLHQPVCCR